LIVCTSVILASCSSQAGQKSSLPSAIDEKGWALCEAAFSAQVYGEGPVVFPVLTLVKVLYDTEASDVGEVEKEKHQTGPKSLDHIEAQSAKEIHSLVCIRQDCQYSGTYTGNGSITGYQVVWDVRLVGWSAGSSVGNLA
jgi:hypothetical protein